MAVDDRPDFRFDSVPGGPADILALHDAELLCRAAKLSVIIIRLLGIV